MNLLLHFEGLAARRCIVAVGGKVWKQTGSIMTSLNNFKFFWKQLGKVFICCCPGNFEIPSLLFDCSDRVYILLSNAFPTLWKNPKFLSRFRSNICTEFLACLINQRERERERERERVVMLSIHRWINFSFLNLKKELIASMLLILEHLCTKRSPLKTIDPLC